MQQPLFITFEGGEGAGKSTQIALLADYLQKNGTDVVCTREPGGSVGAEEIRNLLVRGSNTRWDRLTELLLFSAARRDHLVKTILPALNAGKTVLSDRFHDSTVAYQCFGYGFDETVYQQAQNLYHLIAGDFVPNLTFILDIDPRIGLKRSMKRQGNDEQRFENMDFTFHQNLRAGFLKLAAENSHRYVVINADQPVEKIHQDIVSALRDYLK